MKYYVVSIDSYDHECFTRTALWVGRNFDSKEEAEVVCAAMNRRERKLMRWPDLWVVMTYREMVCARHFRNTVPLEGEGVLEGWGEG